MTHAGGAGRTGLAQLIELSAAGSVGDGFVAVALAGTLFFSASVTEARGHVALALIITMAPFALLAPFIGPLLDRVRHGRRYILIGTMLARGLLCWGMAGAVQHNDTLTLLPAAFGVLVLQKAYGVTRASVTPRLLPAEITLVTANARVALASVIATSIGVPIAAGIDAAAGGHAGGAAWVLRVGTLVYLAAMVPGFRLPSGVDEPVPVLQAPEQQAPATETGAGAAQPGSPGSGHERPGGGRDRRLHRKLFPRPVGPVVGEALGANITLRAYSGFMIFFLAFILRTVHFGGVSDHLALGEMIAAVAAGGLIGTAIGAALRSRAPQVIVFGMLAVALVVTSLCALYFGLWAAAARGRRRRSVIHVRGIGDAAPAVLGHRRPSRPADVDDRQRRGRPVRSGRRSRAVALLAASRAEEPHPAGQAAAGSEHLIARYLRPRREWVGTGEIASSADRPDLAA